MSSAKWQATTWPACANVRSAGSSVEQRSGLPSRSRSQHRVWNRQPDGGAAGDGTSPLSTRRFLRRRGFASGMADSSATVYGWRGSAYSCSTVPTSTSLPEVHDPDAVREVLDDRQVVADEQVGQLELALEVEQQVEDLALDRHVERRDRLVRDDEVRAQRERARDADALPLAAGELVRVAPRVLAPQADELERVLDALVAGLAVR